MARDAAMEEGSGFAFEAGGAALFWNAGNDQRGMAPARSAATAPICGGDLRTVSIQALDVAEVVQMFERQKIHHPADRRGRTQA